MRSGRIFKIKNERCSDDTFKKLLVLKLRSQISILDNFEADFMVADQYFSELRRYYALDSKPPQF